MNWVDLLAILPYYVSLLLSVLIAETSAHSSEEVNTVGKFLKLLKIIRITRSVRIFKLARHVEGLQALGYTFTARINEFGLLLVFLTVGAFSFSSVIYLVEKETGGSLEDMLDAYWWSFITMTTVCLEFLDKNNLYISSLIIRSATATSSPPLFLAR